MTAQRLSRVAAGIAIVTVVGVAALVTRNVLWPEDPDASLQHAGGKVMGDMAGYVGRVDRETRTIDVSTSPLGIRPIAMLVTNETTIVVNGKQGALGDLWKDLPVRVYYEVRDNARYATSIQVTTGDAVASSPATPTLSPASSSSGPQSASASSAKDSKDTKTSSAQASAPQVTTPPAAAPVASAPAPAKPAAPAPAPAVTAPAPVAPPPVPRVAVSAKVPVPAPAATPAPASESASVGSSRVERPAPAESDADGSAAIDWLLKEAGRR